MDDLTTIRQELTITLGDLFPEYMRILRDWFSGKSAKLDLELQLDFLDKLGAFDLHNRYMRGILRESYEPTLRNRGASQANGTMDYSYMMTEGEVGNKFLGENDINHNNENCITLHSAPVAVSPPSTSAGFLGGIQPEAMDLGFQDLASSEGDLPLPTEEEYAEPPPKRDLYTATIIRHPVDYRDPVDDSDEDEEKKVLQVPNFESRLPAWFVSDFARVKDPSNALYRGGIPNVTHVDKFEKRLQRDPRLYKFFIPKTGEDQPVLSSKASVQGRFLIRAWSKGLRTVHPDALAFALKATRKHIREIIIALVKQRKAYEVKDGATVNLGEAHPNPYLLSGPHRMHVESSPILAKFVDPVQVPQLVDSSEEHERLRIMRHATAINIPSRYKTKIGCTDLLNLIRSDKSVIPSNKARHQLLESLLLRARGIFEAPILNSREEEVAFEHEEGELLPVCSY